MDPLRPAPWVSARAQRWQSLWGTGRRQGRRRLDGVRRAGQEDRRRAAQLGRPVPRASPPVRSRRWASRCYGLAPAQRRHRLTSSSTTPGCRGCCKVLQGGQPASGGLFIRQLNPPGHRLPGGLAHRRAADPGAARLGGHHHRTQHGAVPRVTYLFYSGNSCGDGRYATGYAICAGPEARACNRTTVPRCSRPPPPAASAGGTERVRGGALPPRLDHAWDRVGGLRRLHRRRSVAAPDGALEVVAKGSRARRASRIPAGDLPHGRLGGVEHPPHCRQ